MEKRFPNGPPYRSYCDECVPETVIGRHDGDWGVALSAMAKPGVLVCQSGDGGEPVCQFGGHRFEPGLACPGVAGVQAERVMVLSGLDDRFWQDIPTIDKPPAAGDVVFKLGNGDEQERIVAAVTWSGNGQYSKEAGWRVADQRFFQPRTADLHNCVWGQDWDKWKPTGVGRNSRANIIGQISGCPRFAPWQADGQHACLAVAMAECPAGRFRSLRAGFGKRWGGNRI